MFGGSGRSSGGTVSTFLQNKRNPSLRNLVAAVASDSALTSWRPCQFLNRSAFWFRDFANRPETPRYLDAARGCNVARIRRLVQLIHSAFHRPNSRFAPAGVHIDFLLPTRRAVGAAHYAFILLARFVIRRFYTPFLAKIDCLCRPDLPLKLLDPLPWSYEATWHEKLLHRAQRMGIRAYGILCWGHVCEYISSVMWRISAFTKQR